MARIELQGVTRDSGGTRILDNVNLQVAEGEFVTLIGHSGAGKSSVLRAIAGLDPISAGTVRFDGEDVTDQPPGERDVGLVSQHASLFPTHRVRANLMFPLKSRGVGGAEAKKRVEAESRAHSIDHILDRWPESLSGGEQRLAEIARALVRTPRVFLMDEPLARLDIPIRRRMRQEIIELQRGYGVTMVYASNWPDEILTMPDRLVALEGGRVVQSGPPLQVRARPQTLSIAELTGPISRLAVTVEADAEGFWIIGDGIRIRAWSPDLEQHIGSSLTLAARIEDVRLEPLGSITMAVGAKTFVASRSAHVLASDAGELRTFETNLEANASVSLTLDKWLLFSDNHRLIASFPS